MGSPDLSDMLNSKEDIKTSFNPTFCVELRKFPSTRYQGSKRKITPWLWDCFQELDFSSALDVFGGTGSVSFLLKKMGKEVTYNDNLKFNHEIGVALIENDNVVLDQKDVDLAVLLSSKSKHHFVRDTFKGIYFTDKENEWIDNVITNINGLKLKTKETVYKRALLYYALFQSCLIKRPFNLFHRRNLYLRFANVNREFGNKISWNKPFSKHFSRFCAETSNLVFKGQKPCRAIRYEALDLPEDKYDLIYVDPPYLTKKGANESSNYLRCYHFLEGLGNYDNWGNIVDYDSPNRRIKQTCINKWVNRGQNIKAFDTLFEKFAESVFVVSYKKFGTPSISTLIRMLKRHGKRVRSRSRHYKYALNRQNGDAKLNREVILIAE